MNRIIMSFIAGSALASCALPPAGPEAQLGSLVKVGYAATPLQENVYEITYTGPWLGSRDAVEGELLRRAAITARQRGSTWFRFHHMPGEAGPLSHPSRPAPSFGAAYGHWQPHWNYLTTTGWERWHPEWGASFWADEVDNGEVKRVNVHAMIELGRGPLTAAEQTDFDVSAVLRDVRIVAD